MKVKELIEKLQKEDPEAIVWGQYHDSCDDLVDYEIGTITELYSYSNSKHCGILLEE